MASLATLISRGIVSPYALQRLGGNGLSAPPVDPEHEAWLAESRAFSSAMNEASDGGQRGVRDAELAAIQDRFPSKNTLPVGVATIGGGDPGYRATQRPPEQFRGGLSAAIAGLGAPMGYVAPPEVVPDFQPRGDGKKFGEIQSRRLAALRRAEAGAEVLGRMQAGENVSPEERRLAYRHLAASQKRQQAQANKDATLAAAVAGFDSGRTQRMFRQAVLSGDMQSARALLLARQQEIAQEESRGERGTRERALDIQSRSLDDRFELGRMQEDRLRAQKEGELNLGRERLGLGRAEVESRERIARGEQSGLLARMLAAGNIQSLRDANQFVADRTLLGDRIAAEREMRTSDREAAREQAAAARAQAWNDMKAKAFLEMDDDQRRSFLGGDLSLAETLRAGGTPTSDISPVREKRWSELAAGKTFQDFVTSVPIDDIRENRGQFESFLRKRFGNVNRNREMIKVFGSPEKVNEYREELGLRPLSSSTIVRLLMEP